MIMSYILIIPTKLLMSKVFVKNKWKHPKWNRNCVPKETEISLNCVDKKMKNEVVADYGEYSERYSV